MTLHRHHMGYRTTADEVYGRNPLCLDCGFAWPCDTELVTQILDDIVTDWLDPRGCGTDDCVCSHARAVRYLRSTP